MWHFKQYHNMSLNDIDNKVLFLRNLVIYFAFTTIRYYIFCMFFFINLYFMRVRASTIFGLLASTCLHQPACLSYEFASRCFCWIVKKTILIDYLVHIIFINTTLILSRYSHAIISFPRSFLAVNHHNSKN